MSTVARLSLEEYDRMIEAGVFAGKTRRRLELIHGELREMSPIGAEHEVLVDVLNEWGVRNVPPEAAWVRIQNSIGLPGLGSAPEPDIAWVARKDYSAQRPQAADVLLIIEVAESSLAYDRGEKAELYASAGISDYWVVNIPEACVEVYREPEEGRYRSLQTRKSGSTLAPLRFPELHLEVGRLFSSRS